jgi:penicillin V acylase-like amidase (Ntn superfamily)
MSSRKIVLAGRSLAARSLAPVAAALVASAVTLAALAPGDASACTTFRVKTKDGAILFVRATALAWSAVPAATAVEGANAAFHVLNAVDIPIGAVAQRIPGKDGAAPSLAFEQTQWATVHDLANRLLYFRTYGNLAIRKVDLKKVDFTGRTILHIPMPTEMQAEDVTAQAK